VGQGAQQGEADAVRHRSLPALWAEPLVRTPRRAARPVRVALDGETRWMTPPLHFAVAPRPLWLLGAQPTQAHEA
jgi:hypothetical protein